jgi:hypothetical protein
MRPGIKNIFPDWFTVKYGKLIANAKSEYAISNSLINTILWYSIILNLLFGILLILPGTRSFAKWMLLENRPVELLTFFAFFIAGIEGFYLVFKLKKSEHRLIILIFFTVFSLCSLFVGMEEIAWGQWFFHFDTPSYLKEINVQGETTFHNIEGLQGKAQYPDLFFGIAGLIGIWLSTRSYFPHVHVPKLLYPSFVLISFMAATHILHDDLHLVTNPILSFLIRQLDELTELIIGITCLLFIYLNLKLQKR